ncbi:hypothetical protein C4J81_02780 [Deltaproteobacteria bacterium Smac51]|nr:hypothetical protein C4J81_02780 [Deltaproteobacteria bacterium Smac51]
MGFQPPAWRSGRRLSAACFIRHCLSAKLLIFYRPTINPPQTGDKGGPVRPERTIHPRGGRQLVTVKKGFSLIEVMVVVAVVAILALMAVPALSSLVPYAELRSDSRHLATAMRMARLKAANSHKPVRVVVDCSKTADSVCVMRSYVAVFSNGQDGGTLGAFKEWALLPGSHHELAATVTVLENDNFNNGLGVDVSTGNSVFWAVFLPSSRMMASHGPFHLTLASTRNTAKRTLAVDGVTGRASLITAQAAQTR